MIPTTRIQNLSFVSLVAASLFVLVPAHAQQAAKPAVTTRNA
jgi:hypothetical protein